MAIIDLLGGLSKLGDTARNAAKSLEQVNLIEAADQAISSVRAAAIDTISSIEHFDAQEAKDKAANAVINAGPMLIKHFEDTQETRRLAREALADDSDKALKITLYDALRLTRLLMMADNTIDASEEACFVDIVSEMDPDQTCDQTEMVAKLDALAEKAQGDSYIEYLKDEANSAISHSEFEGNGTIDKRLLLWNLLSVAYSDGDYSPTEKELLRLVTRRLEISTDIVQEMEQSIGTMLVISEEELALSNSNRPFSIVNPRLIELKKRRETIMQGVYALVQD